MHLPAASLTLLLSSFVTAHPGHDVREELAERQAFKNAVRHVSLSHCAETLAARGIEDRNRERRAAIVAGSREIRGLSSRDASAALAKSHNKTNLGYTAKTKASEIFKSNSSCVLTPEVTEGPYYVGGEYIRSNTTENQKGVALGVEFQVINVDTCNPVPDVYVEIWHANSTGVYSGVEARGNGNSGDGAANLDATFLRGIQKTDSDGVVQFQTIFPGHYSGRATHIHILVHANATLYANQTLGSDVYASHVGQSYFDQDLISKVEALSPYSNNNQALTTNKDDDILAEGAVGFDPVMDYALLGASISDGLFAWQAFGINTTYSEEVSVATSLYAAGGGTTGSGQAQSGSNSTSGAAPTSLSTDGLGFTIGAVVFSLTGLLLPFLVEGGC